MPRLPRTIVLRAAPDRSLRPAGALMRLHAAHDVSLEKCSADLRARADKHGQPASLVGSSLGSLCARETVEALPDPIRVAFTFGTPFAGHPMARYAAADRLAQPAGGWRPFDPSGARRRFFRTGVAPTPMVSA